MAGILDRFKKELRKEEKALAQQLSGIRNALAALEFGGQAAQEPAVRRVGQKTGDKKRRKFSAKTIARMRKAQRARWAKVKAAAK